MTLRISLVGYGHVGRDKFTPALLALAEQSNTTDYPLLSQDETIELWILDVDPKKEEALTMLRKTIQKKRLNLEIISPSIESDETRQTLEKRIRGKRFDLAYIASPNPTHAHYMDLFLPNTRKVLVEKPIVDHLSELTTLEQTYDPSTLASIQLIDHYLFKAPVIEFFNRWNEYFNRIGPLQRISFSLIEAEKIKPEREWLYQSGIIRDLATHGFSLLFKLHELGCTQLSPDTFKLVKCQKAQYDSIPKKIKTPKETAAQLEYDCNGLPFVMTLGKGAGFQQKHLTISGSKGTIKINTITQSIHYYRNDQSELLYQHKKIQPHHEYIELMTAIFNKNAQIGQSYQNAKTQIKLIEQTDIKDEKILYLLGFFPFEQTKKG
jgi:predicted dehydrogenase